MNMKRKAITLKDVAEEVGVSPNTVSIVLNPRSSGNVRVGPATRTAILKAARRLGYRRNTAAARLVGCQTKTLGILMSSLLDPMAAAVVDAFEEEAVGKGYQCFIGCSRFQGLRKHDLVEQFLSHGVDGLMLTSVWKNPEVKSALRMLLETGMPVVFIDTMWEEHPAPLICGNHYQGGVLLANHLLSVGHRKMSFLCDESQKDLHSTGERLRGLKEALGQSSLPGVNLDCLWAPSHRAEDFASVVHDRLQQDNPPTVILASGDLTAIELIGGLQDYGIEIPRDLCLTGYDDLLHPYFEANLHMNNNLIPFRSPITTIRQPMEQIGRKAAEILIEQINNGPTSTGEEYLLDVELVVRGSSIPQNGTA